MKNEKGNLGREQRKEPGYEVVINAAILGSFHSRMNYVINIKIIMTNDYNDYNMSLPHEQQTKQVM